MTPLLLTALIAAAPAKVPSLASPGLTSPNLSAKLSTFLSDHVAQQLALQGLKVVTSSEIAAVLGLERQKQLLGCNDTKVSACMVELANALGSDGLITGSLARVGKRFHVTIKIIASSTGAQLALFDDEVGSEDALVEALTQAAPGLARDVRAHLAPPGEPPASASSVGLRRSWGWAPTVVGAAALVAGGIVAGLGWSRYGALRGGDVASVGADPVGYAQTGKTLQLTGLVVGGLGALIAIAGSLLLGLGPNDPTAAVVVGPGAIGFSFALALP